MADRRALGRQNAIVFAGWDDAERLLFWERHSRRVRMQSNAEEPSPFSACHLWTGSLQNEYPSVSQGHARSKVKMHILACWIGTGLIPGPKQVVSHLCHRKTCINPDHLVIESIATNNARKGCLCAFNTPDGRVWGLCAHAPLCLRRDTDTLDDFEPMLLFEPDMMDDN